MNAKSTSPITPDPERLDPRDDAPRITKEWADKAELRNGDRIIREAKPRVRIGRPRKDPADVKKPVSFRLSQRVLDAARAAGPGWQSRAAAAIEREFIGAASRADHPAPRKTGSTSRSTPGRSSKRAR